MQCIRIQLSQQEAVKLILVSLGSFYGSFSIRLDHFDVIHLHLQHGVGNKEGLNLTHVLFYEYF